MSSQTSLGLSIPSPLITQPPEKRYISPDNKHELRFTEQQSLPSTKKRKTTTSPLTPDNAATVLGNSFDLSTFADTLAKDTSIINDEKSLFNLMTKCVVDLTVVPFTSVSKRHLKVLGLDYTYRMVLDPLRAAAAKREDSPSNKALFPDILQSMQRHFNVSKESGCRCIIDQYLISAVVYAQQCIDNDPQLKSSLRQMYRIDPHIAVFTELPVPNTKIESGDVSYTFHGYLDYAVGFISADDTPSLGRGSITLDVHETLSGVIEAKSLFEMQNAVPQITAQVLTALMLTGRKAFTGVLTNGALWRFFTAYKQDDKLKIFMSAEFATNDDDGVIIELLKDMIVYPKSPMFKTDFDEPVSYQ